MISSTSCIGTRLPEPTEIPTRWSSRGHTRNISGPHGSQRVGVHDAAGEMHPLGSALHLAGMSSWSLQARGRDLTFIQYLMIRLQGFAPADLD